MFMPSAVAATGKPLFASASPENVAGVSPSLPITTDATTVTAEGGVAPYTYQWTKLTSNTVDSEATSPTSNVTGFRATSGIGPGEQETEVWQCRVEDSLGAFALVNVSATFERFVPE